MGDGLSRVRSTEKLFELRASVSQRLALPPKMFNTVQYLTRASRMRNKRS